jgi:acyl-CoA thioester hydrolase
LTDVPESRFKFIRPITVAFRDIDGMRHVNHAQYLTYCETVRNEYWMEITGITKVEEFDFVLAELTARYQAPAHLRDKLTVGCRVTELRRSSFLVEHEIKNADTGLLIAEVNTAQVMFDTTTGRSIPLSDARRMQIEKYEGRQLTVLTSKSRVVN